MKGRSAFLTCVCIFLLAGCGGNKTTEVTAQKQYFEAIVLEVHQDTLLVEPLDGTAERNSADQISICTAEIGEKDSIQYLREAMVGDRVRIGYLNGIAESYPAQINDVFEVELVAHDAV